MELINYASLDTTWLQVAVFAAVAAGICQCGARKLQNIIWLLAGQSLLITGSALGIGIATGSEHIVVGAVVSAVAKAGLVPAALLSVLRAVSDRSDSKSLLEPGQALLTSLVLTAVAYRSAPGLLPGMGEWANIALPAALALILIGLYIMIARHSAISEVTGLLVMENGIYLAAMAATYGMPLVVELGVLFDALLGVLIMALLVRGMHHHLDTTDTALLRRLRG